MENQTTSSKNIMLNYGVLLGFAGVLINLGLYATGTIYNPHWSVSLIAVLISIAILVMGIKKFKESNGGFLKLGEALKIGLGIALISGLIGVVYTLIFANFIEPNHWENIVTAAREQIIETYPDFGEDQIESALGISKMMANSSMASAMGIAGSLIFGFIVSLIGGLIMKKSDEEITSI